MSDTDSASAGWRRWVVSPDANRALRSTIAFMVPLLLALKGWIGLDVFYMALTAQNLAIVDIRGDYRLRVALLAAMAAVFVGTAALGTAVAHNLPAAIAATVVVMIASSLWRHLSSDYGPGLAIASAFVFFFSLDSPPTPALITAHSVATAAGASWGILIQVFAWPFRPQHPVRRAVSDSWLAVSELCNALTSSASEAAADRAHRMAEKEAELRTTLDAANTAIAARRRGAIRAELQTLNSAAGRLAMRISALNTALDSMGQLSGFASLAPTLDPLLASLANLTRSIALTIVSRQPDHLARSEVRIRRAASLLEVVKTRVAKRGTPLAAAAQLAEILDQIETHLPAVHSALRATVTRANERSAFSFELLDLRALALRPLASSLNLSWKIDPALVRFTYRSAVLTIVGVLAYKELHLAHGYWLPFTMIVVLQPDYGSTRRRAAQRMLGTVAGSIAASVLLFLHLPHSALMAACAVTIFIFGYWIKRNYGIAVIFITLFVVLITEAFMPVTIALAEERLGNTLAGGLLALLAAHLFWPVWERDRLPPFITAALRQNQHYLGVLVARVIKGGTFDKEALAAKRKADRANSALFSSLNRLNGDPKAQREGLEYAAIVANGNQRITRALNVLALHLDTGTPWPDPALNEFVALAGRGFDLIASAITGGVPPPAAIQPVQSALESEPLPIPPDGAVQAQWAFTQLSHVTTELCALLVAIQESAPPRA